MSTIVDVEKRLDFWGEGTVYLFYCFASGSNVCNFVEREKVEVDFRKKLDIATIEIPADDNRERLLRFKLSVVWSHQARL